LHRHRRQFRLAPALCFCEARERPFSSSMRFNSNEYYSECYIVCVAWKQIGDAKQLQESLQLERKSTSCCLVPSRAQSRTLHWYESVIEKVCACQDVPGRYTSVSRYESMDVPGCARKIHIGKPATDNTIWICDDVPERYTSEKVVAETRQA